jgi:raffinose/stachyose/melibiose transport system substrate-binding protein
MRTRKAGINASLIGLLLLMVTIALSLVIVVRNIMAIERPTKTVIRLSHWQLEEGYRDALEHLIQKYEAMHPEIDIQQMPITEKVYSQWINTQLISGTAPDIVEMGQSNMIFKDEYTVKYFIPLGDEVVKPNPYNKGTNLEGVAWKETLVDGMRGGFRDNLQDYFMVPTSMIGMRLFVNTTLLEKATGSRQLPQTFEQMMQVCEQVREYGRRTAGGKLIPIVSCYGLDNAGQTYLVPFTAKFEKQVDLDLDGIMSIHECYRSYVRGDVNFDTPAIRAYTEATKRIADQMQRGFSSMDRQQATFHFVNGNAAFLWSGSWDAKGTIGTATQNGYDVELMRWPLPAPGERYAEFIAGKQNEAASRGAGPYGVFRFTPNRQLALDFLRFLTSQEGNQEFNQRAGWPPVTIGATPSEIMAPFMPDPVGYTSSFNLKIGTRVQSELNAKMMLYYQGESGFEGEEGFGKVVKAYEDTLFNPRLGGDWACWKDFDQKWRDCRNQDRVLAREVVEELMDPAHYDPVRYKRTLLQQMRRNNGRDLQYLFETFRGQPMPMY